MNSIVSVVIPTHNRAALVQRAVASVLAQSYSGWEILVIDDHSSEDIATAVGNLPVRLLRTEARGVSAARNTGIRAARGSHIAFLDSDDEWLPQKLEQQMNYIAEHPSTLLVHCNEQWMRDGKLVSQQRAHHQKFGGRIFDKCVESCVIGSSCTLVRTDVFTKYGLFDESFPVCEDFDLWLRIAAREEIGFIKDALVIKYGGHADQLSRQFHSMDLWRLRALAKHLDSAALGPSDKLALQKSILLKSKYYLDGLKKRESSTAKTEVEDYQARAYGLI